MKRSSAWLTALLQTVILITVVASAAPWRNAAATPLPTPRHAGDITLRGFTPRPVFNGSVVPGGVYSPAEVRAAVEHDAVVAAHYRRVRIDDLQAVTLTKGRAAYVSYRKGDRIHWTRERVWLKAGETVLTDGTTTIRARCGNCVSDVKDDSDSGVSPASDELDDLEQFVVPATADLRVDPVAAAAEAQLMALLDVPFAPQMLAELESRLAFPPVFVGGGGGVGGGDTPPGVVVVPVPPVPPVPPIFVPPTIVPTDTTSTGTVTGSPTTTTVGFETSGDTPDDTSGEPSSGSTSGATAAPEPATVWLVGAAVIGVVRRRLRRAQS